MKKLAAAVFALALPLAAQATYALAPVGPGCGGATLHAYFTDLGNHKYLNLDCSGLFSNEFGWIVYGTEQIAVTLPGNCTVWTNFVYGHTFRSDGVGVWNSGHAWPASILAQFNVQIATFREVGGQLELKTTNCVHAEHL